MLTIAADPEASRRPHRHHLRAAHLGLGDDPSSACPHDRAGRRHLARRHALGRRAGRASSCRCACSRACSGGCSWRSSSPPTQPAAAASSASMPISPMRDAFAAYLAPLRKAEWVVYAKRPFAGPEAVLAYLSRYTHRVAISNSRLIAFDEQRRHLQVQGLSRSRAADRYKTMTLATDEFIRRFLHPRAAEGLPSHPPLRPVRQGCLRRQHRTRARAARRCKTEDEPRCRYRSQQADLSMLRRSHAHHRGLRAWRNATASADSSNDCHQARQLMTASQSRKSGNRARRLSTGHGRARSDTQLPSQIARQLIMSDAIRRPFTGRFAAGQLAGRFDPDLTPHPRLSNLHSARATALRSPRAVSLYGLCQGGGVSTGRQVGASFLRQFLCSI